MRDSSID